MEPFYQELTGNKIYNGDALEVLKTLPDESVQMCMTSPPYWGLRNYAGGSDLIWVGDENCQHEWGELLPEHHPGQVEQTKWKNAEAAGHGQTAPSGQFCSLCGAWRGQLGLEPTPELYVEHLMMIFREIKRVLRKDGSFYLNIGDTYWGGKGQSAYAWSTEHTDRDTLQKPYHQITGMGETRPQDRWHPILQPKCMTCIPERVLFAMLKDGWWLRNKIIWHKPNAMPGSQKDRFTCSWEYLYFFTKARKYYFDLDAVREPHNTQSLERYMSAIKRGEGGQGKLEEGIGAIQHRIGMDGIVAIPKDIQDLFGHGPQPQLFNLRVRDVKRGKRGVSTQGGELKASEKEIKEYDYPEKHHGSSMNNQDRLHIDRARHGFGPKTHGGMKTNITKPEDGPEPNAFHPKGKNPGDYWDITTRPSSICVCPKCEAVFPRYTKICPSCKIEGVVGHFAPYPVALCETPIKASTRVEDVVLDPLSGGGNTGVAAKMLGRKCILIDCVKEYCIMAKHKLSKVEYQPKLT